MLVFSPAAAAGHCCTSCASGHPAHPLQVYYDGEFVQALVCLNIVNPVNITSIECHVSKLRPRLPALPPCAAAAVLRSQATQHAAPALPAARPCCVRHSQLVAIERTHWTETHTTGSGSNQHTHTVPHGGKVTLLDVTHPLGGVGRRMEAGQ